MIILHEQNIFQTHILSTFIMLLLVSYFLKCLFQGQTRAEWQIVFYVAAAIYIIGATFFVIFASGDLQPWAEIGKLESKSQERELTSNTNGEEHEMLSDNNELI